MGFDPAGESLHHTHSRCNDARSCVEHIASPPCEILDNGMLARVHGMVFCFGSSLDVGFIIRRRMMIEVNMIVFIFKSTAGL